MSKPNFVTSAQLQEIRAKQAEAKRIEDLKETRAHFNRWWQDVALPLLTNPAAEWLPDGSIRIRVADSVCGQGPMDFFMQLLNDRLLTTSAPYVVNWSEPGQVFIVFQCVK